ncbi:glycoside hydrolase family 3 C-terminal domain-containing protein [Flavobacterium sp. NG2]|uniref:glycoside hydrolase family 3 C-terminal domain-containing protein n=1 Tax=Flavobacterium sp. NG2 TaxID=3097547 RepID=UPI002A7F604D|nr:glycoside hydrolase family 3 C-terminal domain-containing protein [Flavobacterium sp. NG2]WPR71122.1 glycoside hydrolase family 3 C-terminal domain-containing protein [Flavobacterium sp. NG2]
MKINSKIILFLMPFVSMAQEVNFKFQDASLSIDERVEILVSQMTVEEQMGQLRNNAPAIPRLNIPDYDWWNEALHGVARNGKATIFPQGIGIGATFDPDLAFRVASAISTEARAKYNISQQMGNHSKFAGLTFWTPNVNIFRDPRWGRGQETYGEDPYLMSKIGVAFVKGLQGEDPKFLKSAACAKHFAVHSGPESLRLVYNAVPTKQDLWETYMPAFEALVKEAKVEGVMPAHNAVYGKPMAANPEFLTDILRTQWKFDGYVVTDCGAVKCIYDTHKFVKTEAEAAAVAFNAGTNLFCGGNFGEMNAALKQGLVSKETIRERTKQLLKTRFRLGMFDKPDNNPYAKLGINEIHSQETIALAKEAAQKSIVLLKNTNNTLPISKNVKIPYVTGPFANSSDMLMGSYYGISPGIVTILAGIADVVSPGTSLNYRSGALPFHDNLNPKNWAPNVAKESDITICVVGITADREGEGVDAIASDHKGDRKDLSLPENQVNYVKKLAENKKGPLVLVIASGSPVSLEGIEDKCDAIVQIWYPGEQGGNAVADVLFGNVSPSGHLPLTFPKNLKQLPPFEDYSMKGRTYKYMTEEPMYPFGFGLTYSKTELSNLKLNSTKLRKNEGLTVKVDVANVGDFDIDEVVQLYICPEDTSGGIPLKSLKAFERIALNKSDKKTVSFSITADDLKVIDTNGKKVWRKGNYKIVVGNASPGALSTKLGAALPQETIIELK